MSEHQVTIHNRKHPEYPDMRQYRAVCHTCGWKGRICTESIAAAKEDKWVHLNWRSAPPLPCWGSPESVK